MAEEGIRSAPTPLSYNDVRWLLDDHQAKRAGPLRWHTEVINVEVPNAFIGRTVVVKTLQELWQVGADEFEWRNVEEDV